MSDIEERAISTIKLLSVDQVAKANSGHPGAPLGLATVAHAIWKQMRFNPKNPDWINRDRFVLSNGHAVALLYSLLHLFGYPLTIDDLKNFRQLGSKTPGHPEAETPGIEVTTGPLGQGISNAVGLAIAQKQFAARYNKPDFTLSDNYTYVILGDGCLQEGVASEACSLAGHLQLNNLIAFYDDNHITIDGNTNVSFTEDVNKRFEAYGWEVQWIKDGNNDLNAINKALEQAKKSNKPTLIRLTTIIGYGSLQQGSHSVHGSPLKADDIKQLKEKLGFNPEENFVVPQEVYDYYNKETIQPGQKLEEEWNALFKSYSEKYPEQAKEITRRLSGELPSGWEEKLPSYTKDDKALATRKLSEMLLDSIFDYIPELIGGSADLTGSNLTRSKEATDFQPDDAPAEGNYAGRYIRYGVREHGMGAIMNGISAFGANYKAYGGTFLNFVSYAAGAVRLSALSGHPVVWVATHDSIGLGEDGPTHQPIETLAHFRATPNLKVWRPADGNEVSAAYKVALGSKHTPSIIALSRQNLPQLEGSSVAKAEKGGYVVKEAADAQVILVATGSEVSLAIEGAEALAAKGVSARVVSLPDQHTFDQQSKEYRLSVLPDGIPIVSIEVLTTTGWAKYSHEQFGIDRFGASGKASDVYKFFEFTADGVADRALKTIEFYKGSKIVSPLNKAFYSVV
ncbi:transketolase TKL1 [Cyberlindnera jadinii NRRL Y-1542]|uniref:transketolase n=1 Tax=Cyberlindnera jadinii (strain ATCC 18201 / CBS 1600 / BCRC 20928 / JCM 3617 / NBRC 0987 / NRRL Y-1542) TaxID=983966 RepID=A0A1E4S3S3_CYBJN|nr:transketolase [Cyberlindnera jadinii NRRL Y-1542]ODV74168.1 transketolase [Cyberlindnera jadinii NRRL Y-1542]